MKGRTGPMFFLLSDLLQHASERFPAKMAVACGKEAISYAELAELAQRIAATLIEQGLHPGDRVGIYAVKSVRAIAAICGVLQAGGVYVPLDPLSPTLRCATICQDCSLRFLLTTSALLPNVRALAATCDFHALCFLDEIDSASVAEIRTLVNHISSWENVLGQTPRTIRPPRVEGDPAYILYTSGSTGVPKGVVLSHRNALAFITWAQETFAVSERDRLANHAPLHFDLSIFDVFVAFSAGASLLLVPPEINAFPADLVRWIEKTHITIWYSVPSILKMMLQYGRLDQAKLSDLRLVLFAGEVFPLKYLQMLVETFPQCDFCNLYGPTETNVCTFYCVPKARLAQLTDLPIGKACEHCEVFALNVQGERIQLPGEEGELYVRGPAVMLGYWGNDAATRDTLVELSTCSPHGKGLAYRTGDRVRLDMDGNFFFLGRNDHLVKSRGYRIELGEIETVLHAHPAIESAVVIPLPDDLIGNRLEACVVFLPGARAQPEELRAHCIKRLPHYMVPTIIHVYPSFTLTGTAKIDRVRLRTELTALAQNQASADRQTDV